MAKELKDMTVAEAKASGQEQEYSNLVAGYGQGTPSNLVAPSNTITSDQMTPTPSLKLPETKPTPTIATGMGASLETQSQDYKDTATKEAEVAKDTSRTELTNLIKSSIGETGATDEAYRSEGVDTAKQELNDINNQLISEQVANRRRIEQIEKNAGGMLSSGVQAEINRINKESISKQADLAVIQMAKQNNYFGAKEIADRSVAAKMEEQRQNIDLLKFIYEENKADFSQADNRAYQALITKQEREADEEEKRLQTISNLAIEALRNGASQATAQAITNSKTVSEAINNAGSSLVSPKEKLELEKLRGDIEKNKIELANAKTVLGGTTGDPVLDIISASAKYGDKRINDSQLEKIQQAQQALGGLETLQGLLSQGKDGLNTTGPLSGRARTLVSQLGGDADARAINATIQGLVPTIARGIFGEVGVLTDADIENYKKTVPNLTSTEAQNKLISTIMYDVLSRSVESTLVTNAQNQANVSGFIPTYNDIKSRIQDLKSNLGVPETSNIDPLNKSKMEIGWSTMAEDITGTLNSYLQ